MNTLLYQCTAIAQVVTAISATLASARIVTTQMMSTSNGKLN